jgi:hypothetical protein
VPKNKIRKRVTHVDLAPLRTQIAPVTTLKKKPRGKPFAKGNRYGLTSRFRKGEPSANPDGRPSYKKQSEACREQLAAVVPRHELHAAKLPAHLFGKTYAEVNAWVMEQEGLRGNISALAEMADRAEGRPGVALGNNDGPDPLDLLVVAMTQMSATRDKPEGWIPVEAAQGDDAEENTDVE